MINLDKTSSSTKTRVLSDGELFQVVGGFGHHRSSGNHGGGMQRRNGNQGNRRPQVTFNFTFIFVDNSVDNSTTNNTTNNNNL
jgi:hypothetical protein